MSYDVLPAHESTRKRRRWGCTCGCLVLLTMLFVLGTLTTYYLLESNEKQAPMALMDPRVDGYGVLRIDNRDEGISQMTNLLFGRTEQAQKAKLTGQDAQVMSLVLKTGKQFVTSLVQPDSAIYMSYDANSAVEDALISIPMKNRLSFVLANRLAKEHAPGEPVEKAGNGTVYPLSAEKLSSGPVISVSPDGLIISNDLTMVTRGLQNAAETATPTEPQAKLQRYIDELGLDAPPQGEDLALAFVNEPSRVTTLLINMEEWLGIEDLAGSIQAAVLANGVNFDDLDGMKITGDLVTADQLILIFTCYTATSDMAAKFAEAGKGLTSKFTGQPLESGLTISAASTARGSTAVIEMDITGIKNWIRKTIPVPASDDTATTVTVE